MPSIIHHLTTAARRAAEVARSGPRRRKYPWAPWWAPVRTEANVHPHSPAERAELFEAFNAGTTEYEVLNWLYATVMLLKPQEVLETGAADGIGTVALASACRNNGFGTVHSVEIEPDLCRAQEIRLRRLGLVDFAQVHCMSSLDYLRGTDTVFDVGFFDSLCELRAEEFRTCLDRGIIRKLAVFHDTSPLRTDTLPVAPSPELHAAYRRDVLALARDPRCTGWYESTLSRGFIAIFVDPNAVASADSTSAASRDSGDARPSADSGDSGRTTAGG